MRSIERELEEQNSRWAALIAEARACDGLLVDPQWLEELADTFTPVMPAAPMMRGLRA